jgi:hypothetical protein
MIQNVCGMHRRELVQLIRMIVTWIERYMWVQSENSYLNCEFGKSRLPVFLGLLLFVLLRLLLLTGLLLVLLLFVLTVTSVLVSQHFVSWALQHFSQSYWHFSESSIFTSAAPVKVINTLSGNHGSAMKKLNSLVKINRVCDVLSAVTLEWKLRHIHYARCIIAAYRVSSDYSKLNTSQVENRSVGGYFNSTWSRSAPILSPTLCPLRFSIGLVPVLPTIPIELLIKSPNPEISARARAAPRTTGDRVKGGLQQRRWDYEVALKRVTSFPNH